jgi:undecaprenyl-diphosphatase
MAEILARVQQLDAAWFLAWNGARHPLLDLLMPILSDKRFAVIPAALLALALLRWGGRRAWLLAAAAVLALAASDLAANLAKAVFQRSRPCHALAAVQLLAGCTGSFALPSNHASNMAAVTAVAWLGSWRLGLAALALMLSVGFSRVYLGVHYPGDVLGGFALGGAAGSLVGCLALRLLPRLERWCPRRFAPGPPPPAVPPRPSSQE